MLLYLWHVDVIKIKEHLPELEMLQVLVLHNIHPSGGCAVSWKVYFLQIRT